MQLAVAFAAPLMGGGGLMKIGLLAASTALSMFMNKGGQKANRLNDLKVSCSTYGKGLPLVYGSMRCTGNMFWATDIVEKKKYYNQKGKDITGKKKDSKKGTKVYEYYGNFAMALCEGPVDEVLRIWADSNLIYDKYNPDNEDLVGPGFSQGDGDAGGKGGKGGGKKKGSGDSGRFGFRFYAGDEHQMPDPFMVETQGAEMVPGYRDTCYLFFEEMALMDFGNRIPTITAEVTVKKKRDISFAYCRPLVESDIPGYSNPYIALADPQRYRLYTFHDLGSDTVVRTWDLASMKETKRTLVTGTYTVPVYNGLGQLFDYTTINVGGLTCIGMSSHGDFVMTSFAGNTTPVVFVDCNSGRPKGIFGTFSAALSNTNNSIQRANHASPIVVLEPSATGEVTQTFITAIASQFGAQSYFNGPGGAGSFSSALELKGFMNGTPSGDITPGFPAISKSHYYIHNNPDIYRVSYPGGYIGDPSINKEMSPTHELFYTPDLLPGESAWNCAPFIVLGAECLATLESRSSTDPDRDGWYGVKIDPATGKEISRIKVGREGVHFTSGNIRPTPLLTGNKMIWLGQTIPTANTVFEVDFRSEEAQTYTLSGMNPVTPTNFQAYWSPAGAVVHGGIINDGSEFNGMWSVFLAKVDRLAQVPVDVKDIFIDLGQRVGIPNEKLNVSLLNPQEIKGFIIEHPTEARQVVEDLTKVFMFDVVESDYQLKAISRGRSFMKTIPQNDLGVIDSGMNDGGGGSANGSEYFKETVTQAIDCPQTVNVSYVNAEDDYQTNTQHYRRPRSPMPVMHSRDVLDLNLPMAMEPDFAKQLAQKVCLSVWSERKIYDMVVPWTYLAYDPADVLRFQMNDGLTFDNRLMKADIGADFSLEITGVSQTPSTYSSSISGSKPGGAIPQPTHPAPITFPIVLDVPFLSDGDVDPAGFTYYWGAAAYTSGLKFAALERRLPPADFKTVDITTIECVYGTVVGNLPPPPHGDFATDDQTVIVLAPAHEFTTGGDEFQWESIPEEQWPSEQNMVIVGDEVILFRDVEENPDGTKSLSHLIRGWRGTEEAANNHGDQWNETFIIVTDEGIRALTESPDYIGNEFHFRTQSPGLLFNMPIIMKRVLTGASLKPYAPGYFNRLDDTPTAGSIRVTWARRTRYGGGLKNSTGTVPLNEETELYNAYVLEEPYSAETFDPDNPATYKRAFLGLTTPQFTYEAADQGTDGYDAADPLYVVAFQLSATVGMGFPGHDILYPTILIEPS